MYLLSVPLEDGVEDEVDDECADDDREKSGEGLSPEDCLRGVSSVPSDLTRSNLLLCSAFSVARSPENSFKGVME